MFEDCNGNFRITPSKVNGITAQETISILSYIGIAVASVFDKDIREDMNNIHWNPFNSDATVAANSNKVSFYKGVPVYKISGMGGSASFGAIFLDSNCNYGNNSIEDVLKHERGHNTQLMNFGLIEYLVGVAIPSPIYNDSNTPWELSASMLGGSKMADSSTSTQKIIAHIYSFFFQIL